VLNVPARRVADVRVRRIDAGDLRLGAAHRLRVRLHEDVRQRRVCGTGRCRSAGARRDSVDSDGVSRCVVDGVAWRRGSLSDVKPPNRRWSTQAVPSEPVITEFE
jgi:hypothetical protein